MISCIACDFQSKKSLLEQIFWTGHLHRGVILLQLTESFRILFPFENLGFLRLCYLNLTGISKF